MVENEANGVRIYEWERLWVDPHAVSHRIAIDTVVWVGSAVAAGIVGNAAYDILKERVQELRSGRGLSIGRGFEKPGAMKTYELRFYMDFVAKHAVIQQCEEHGLPVPEESHLRVLHWYRKTVDGALVREAAVVGVRKSPFSARVRIQVRHPERRRIEVFIATAATWEFQDPAVWPQPTRKMDKSPKIKELEELMRQYSKDNTTE